MTLPDWFENAFALMIALSVVHYALVFYSTLLRKIFGLLAALGGRLAGRAAGPVSYRRTDG